MPTYVIPAVFDTTKKFIRPAGPCERIDPKYFCISPQNLISSDAANALKTGADHKLHVRLVSAQSGNILKQGNDYGVYLDAANILSNAGTNLLTTSSTDDRIILTRKAISDAGFADEGVVEDLFARHLSEITASKESAANSATSAANSATNARTSATNAANSADNAQRNANAAATSANAAAASATNAANSATSAANSATTARFAATDAQAQAQAAGTHARDASDAAGRAETAARSAASDAAIVRTDRAYVDGLIDHAEAVVREEAARIAAESITPQVVEQAADRAVVVLENGLADVREDLNEHILATAEAFSTVAATDAMQAYRLVQLDQVDQAQSDALDRARTQLSDKIDTTRTQLTDEIEQVHLSVTEALSTVAATDAMQAVQIGELRHDFNEKQINDVTRFSDLSYASVVHTREIFELQETADDAAWASCEAVTSLALTSVAQSVMLAEMYQRLSA